MKQYLQRHHPELVQCRILARVYASFETLSQTKASTEVAQGRMLSQLGRFAAGFSIARTFFDFINLDSEVRVESKIIRK